MPIKCDVTDVKKKIESLLGSFRRERQREDMSKRSGAGTDGLYHSKWFAYQSMKFLSDKFQPRSTIDTIQPVSKIFPINKLNLINILIIFFSLI